LEVLSEWIVVKDKIFTSDLKVIFVLGGVDTGKTTFVHWLANQGIKGKKVIGIIDADVGQSNIGPPTTIGLGIINEEVESLSLIEPKALFFVGDISPEKHLLDMVVGTRKLFNKLLENKIDKVIIDTTGLVQGEIGQVLKLAKIRNIGMGHIIALQRKNEIEHILKPLERMNYIIHRIPISSKAKLTSREERAILRNKKFILYFKNCFKFDLLFSEIATINTPFLSGQKLTLTKLNKYEKEFNEIILYAEVIDKKLYLVTPDKISLRRNDVIGVIPEDFENLLVGLIDEKDDLLGLGIIEKLDFKNESLKIKSPIDSIKKVKLIKFSELRLKL